MSDKQFTWMDAVNYKCCVGCGVCAYMKPDIISMHINEHGFFEPKLSGYITDICDIDKLNNVCPFTDYGPDEDAISETVHTDCFQYTPEIGHYDKLYVGHAIEGCYRDVGSSGGMTTWLLNELIKGRMVDYVVSVKPNKAAGKLLFEYSVTNNVGQVLQFAKSRYYPIEMSQVLQFISINRGSYVIVGLPCFIKAIRRLMIVDKELRSRIQFMVSLVCGHLKSKHMTDSLAIENNIDYNDVMYVDYRVKEPGRKVTDYSIMIESVNKTVTVPARKCYTYRWSHGLYQYPCCDYCDDIYGETSDVSFGDAWLPEYVYEPKGQNIIISRSPVITRLIEQASGERRIEAKEATIQQIHESQAGGIRHRREGLSYRLQCTRHKHPHKRLHLLPSQIQQHRRDIYQLRMAMRELSMLSWPFINHSCSIDAAKLLLNDLIHLHDKLYMSKYKRILRRIRILFKTIIKRMS